MFIIFYGQFHIIHCFNLRQRPLWLWSYGSWIYNYLCNQCLSPLMLWARILIRARCTTLCVKVCQWLATCRLFSPSTPVSSTNKTDRHDIAEILLKVALYTIANWFWTLMSWTWRLIWIFPYNIHFYNVILIVNFLAVNNDYIHIFLNWITTHEFRHILLINMHENHYSLQYVL